MLLIADDIFSLLEFAAFGAYAVSVDQTILYWNPEAERILGHRASDVIGRRCYDVVAGRGARGVAPECLGGCPSIRYMRAGLLPSPLRLQMLCSSGERKWVSVTPMAVTGILGDSHAIVHMFEEAPGPPDSEQTEDSPRDTVADARNVTPTNVAAGARSEEAPSLSLREQEVLHLVAQGWATTRIAAELGISRHTVRNHVRNLRHKLNASTKLTAVVTAIRLGILDIED